MNHACLLSKLFKAQRKRDKWDERVRSLLCKIQIASGGSLAASALPEPVACTAPTMPEDSLPTVGSPRWPFSEDTLGEFAAGGKYFGLQSRVAKQLGVHRTSVGMVARGKLATKRIIDALVAEMEGIDERLGRTAKPNYSPYEMRPLSDQEQVQFRAGGRYYGSLSVIALAAKSTRQMVWQVVNGRLRTAHVLAAVRQEMYRVDTEINSHLELADA